MSEPGQPRVDAATAAEVADDQAFDQALKQMVADADLVDVRVTKWHAELFADEPVEIAEIDLKVSSAFRYRDGGFETKFSVDVPLSSAGNSDEVANVQVDVVASFISSSGNPPDRHLLGAFMEQVALFVVMPFIRESLHSLSMRIGLEPITLGLMQQGRSTPATAWSARRNHHGVSTEEMALEPPRGG